MKDEGGGMKAFSTLYFVLAVNIGIESKLKEPSTKHKVPSTAFILPPSSFILPSSFRLFPL